LLNVEAFDRDHHAMRPCSLELCLSFAQDVLLKELARCDDRLKLLTLMSDDQNETDHKDLFKEFTQLRSWIALRELLKKEPEKLLYEANRGQQALASYLKENLKTSKYYDVSNIEAWSEKFWTKLETIRIDSTKNIGMVSISSLTFEKGNYNLKVPIASHRLSDQLSAAILFNAPALVGCGFFETKRTVGKECQLFVKEGRFAEERTLIDLLKNLGRGGYQVYLFAAHFGSQKYGQTLKLEDKEGEEAEGMGKDGNQSPVSLEGQKEIERQRLQNQERMARERIQEQQRRQQREQANQEQERERGRERERQAEEQERERERNGWSCSIF